MLGIKRIPRVELFAFKETADGINQSLVVTRLEPLKDNEVWMHQQLILYVKPQQLVELVCSAQFMHCL